MVGSYPSFRCLFPRQNSRIEQCTLKDQLGRPERRARTVVGPPISSSTKYYMSQSPESTFSRTSSVSQMITPDSSVSEGKGSRKKKACLSEEQKKKHHIESEHRRRLAIRDAFSRLAELVPELDPVDARSEILVMSKSADYLKQLYLEHRSLLMQLEQKGTPVDQALKLRLPDVDLDSV